MKYNIPLMKELRLISNLVTRAMTVNGKEKGLPIPFDPENNKDKKKPTPMQGLFIGYIFDKEANDEDVFQKDLEKHFMIRRSTATEILKLMEKNNLIKKESVNHDARLKKIVLTEQARKEHIMIYQNIKFANDLMMKDFSEEEKIELYRLLGKVKKNLGEIDET